jgi:ribosome-associated translation inhibitor RaiA
MNIEVTAIARTCGRQTRAYAEYRVFSSLAQFTGDVRDVAVSLTLGPAGHSVRCAVVVTFASGAPIRITARGRHAYDAINRVARRIGPALHRHASVALSS